MIMSAEGNFQQACFWGLKTKHFWLRGCGPSLCVCMLAVVVAVLIAYDYDCARTLWASRPFGGEAALARRESLQLRPCWPNIEPQMIGQKEEKKKAELRGPFPRPTSGPQNQPSIGKGTNCGSENWPRFWGQLWCCKRVFSVCMCTLKWIRGAYICPASWPGFKNTIADPVCNCRKKLWLYVRYGDFSRLFCSMFLAVHSIYIYTILMVFFTRKKIGFPRASC